MGGVFMRGHRLFQCRVGPAQFERRPTIGKCRENRVGRRGEAPLVPPYGDRPYFVLGLAVRVRSISFASLEAGR